MNFLICLITLVISMPLFQSKGSDINLAIRCQTKRTENGPHLYGNYLDTIFLLTNNTKDPIIVFGTGLSEPFAPETDTLTFNKTSQKWIYQSSGETAPKMDNLDFVAEFTLKPGAFIEFKTSSLFTCTEIIEKKAIFIKSKGSSELKTLLTPEMIIQDKSPKCWK